MFYVWIVLVVTWKWTSVKVPWTGHTEWTHFLMCQSLSIKVIFKERIIKWDVNWQVLSLSHGTWFHREAEGAGRCQPWRSVLPSSGPQGKQDTLWFRGRSGQGPPSRFAESNFRALGVGRRADSISTMSSSCSLAPQCSLHLIFQKHQQIRKEVRPEIAIWMNVTFVGQQRKLEELMYLQLTASSHGPHSKQYTHL